MQGDPTNTAPIAAGSSSQAMNTLRIVAGAMIAGSALFLVVAAATRGQQLLADDPWNIMEPLTLVGLVIAVAVPYAIFAAANRLAFAAAEGLRKEAKGAKPDPAWPGWPPLSPMLYRAYQTATILEFAGLEGPAFFNGIAYMVEGSAISAIVAAALIGVMTWKFPVEDRVRGWMEGALSPS
ncbi:MAG: hypothetical protein U0800_21230 [Isosphaeraceae bacterium]